MRAHTDEIVGRRMLILPQVFNPRLFHSGEFFARQLSEHLIPPNCSVLDMGTGTGIGAVTAAQWARRVVAVDINAVAVRCAQANVQFHQLEGRVEARLGDLFTPVGVERFDIVLFNPPFLRGAPTEPFEYAFFSTDIADRFAEGLRDHLNTGGYALLLLSSLGETATFLQALRWRGFRIRILVEQDRIMERFTLYQVCPEPAVHDLPRPEGTGGPRTGNDYPV
jgi:release factor glutamine methyltransferase